jgi:hypothetical protein
MDNSEIYDSQLTHRNASSVMAFLAQKQTPTPTRKVNDYSVATDVDECPDASILPNYCFIITDYLIG